MWDTLDRLINKPQPVKLAQISPALGSYHEASKRIGENTDFYQWLNGIEGINLEGFMKTGIVTAWDAEGFIKEQFRKFALEQPEAFDLLQKRLERTPAETAQEVASAFLSVLAKLLQAELTRLTFHPTGKLPWRRRRERERRMRSLEHSYRVAPTKIQQAPFVKLASEVGSSKASPHP
jgi:hypothetical protein